MKSSTFTSEIKLLNLSIVLLISLLFSCNNTAPGASQENAKDKSPNGAGSLPPKSDTTPAPTYQSKILYADTFATGNFDHIKGVDTAWLMVPMKEFEMYGCSPCSTRVVFSNGTDSICFTEGDIGGGMEIVGDLNDDGVDELAYYDAHFNGCWADLRLYSLKGAAWKEINNVSFYACADKPDLSKRIKKKNHKILLLGDNADNTGIKTVECVFEK
jgi:hypothetical protein